MWPMLVTINDFVADACDNKRFLALTEESKVALPQIKIRANSDDNTLILEDSGVGMTKDKIVNNLGNIAQSDTHAFAQTLGEGSADEEKSLKTALSLGSLTNSSSRSQFSPNKELLREAIDAII
jgi:hypothetical protein